MTPRQLAERLAQGEPLAFLDVRRPNERAYCAIPLPTTALDVHIVMDEIPARLDDVRAATLHGPVVVYCHHGVRSQMVIDWLGKQGLAGLLNLDGGIDAWSNDVDPTVPRY